MNELENSFQCSDCKNFADCEITSGASCEPCLDFSSNSNYMNKEDTETLRANFKYLRKHKDFVTHQFIHAYISALNSHNIIDDTLYLKLSAIADDYI